MTDTPAPSNFIRDLIQEDLNNGRFQHVHTRFPPEPNGYLHIGHAKAFIIDFGIALDYGGKCNLRFDDTNPVKEETEYVDAIMEDIRWIGYDWEDRLFYASDYFEQLYLYAVKLIEKGKAYVDDLSADEIREYRGTLTEPGKDSPYRNRTVEGNLDLFNRMRDGEFSDGHARPPREDRYGFRKHEHARSGNVSNLEGHSSPDRRSMVHLPDVRFCTWPKRLDRRDHPLVMLA